jgi:hypothetical protein
MTGIESRSSTVHEVGLPRSAGLEDAYTEAWQEWQASDHADLWDSTVADGIALR